jgi:hypothetical protein
MCGVLPALGKLTGGSTPAFDGFKIADSTVLPVPRRTLPVISSSGCALAVQRRKSQIANA